MSTRSTPFREPTDEELALARRIARLACLGEVKRFTGYFDRRSGELVVEVEQRITPTTSHRLENPKAAA